MARPDDESIADSTLLLRVLRVQGWWMVESDGHLRATSLAFVDGYTGETSCHFDTLSARILTTRRFPRCPVARFKAGQARSHGFNVTRDPEGDPEGAIDHVVLTFAEEGARRKVYQGACKKLALDSEVIESSDLELGIVQAPMD
jgi:hypothetical protein